jgi:predicted kinase
MPKMRPVLFYTVGLPGAGKTTFASSLSYWLGIGHLRGDKIGLELFRIPTFSPQERQIVYAEMGQRAAGALQGGRHAVYDAAVNTREQREQLAALARQHGGTALGIWVQVPTGLAKQRAGTVRDSGLAGPVARVIPPHIFDQYAAAFEAPAADEPVIYVAGNAPFALQYRRLKRQLGGSARGLPTLV